jgi:predicted nucleotidyltransferase
METAVLLDFDAIRRACEQFGVKRLRVFGSVLTEHFDPETSDIDLVVERSVRNPFFRASAFGNAQDIYAA